jgi:hypothetical protein
MYRLKKFLGNLEHYELIRLKQDIDKGNLNIEKEIKDSIREKERNHSSLCATCTNILDTYNSNNYTIIFGREDFKKKASFCGLDCLEYFLIKLKQIKRGEKNETKKIE